MYDIHMRVCILRGYLRTGFEFPGQYLGFLSSYFARIFTAYLPFVDYLKWKHFGL